MGPTRLQIILIMGLMAFAVRALPQMFLGEGKFPERWERLLHCLSYALISSIVGISLFMSGSRFQPDAAPHRAVALAVAIVIAHRTQSPVSGMIIGTILVSFLSRIV